MLDRLRRLLPTPEFVRNHRWLLWLGPALHHPRLWHMSRRGIALGVALGMFFGFLVPIAQIPLSAAAAVLLRANVPCAIASTLVTNPFTFGPVYFAAWKVGNGVLGVDRPAPPPPAALVPAVVRPDGTTPAAAATLAATDTPWWRDVRQRVAGVGKPLVVGLSIFAVVAGLGAYLLVTWVWWARTMWRRRCRRQSR